MIWANQYTKEYLKDYPIDPPIVVPGLGEVDNTGILLPLIQDSLIKPFQWWDQNGTALASDYFSWTSDFQDGTLSSPPMPMAAGSIRSPAGRDP